MSEQTVPRGADLVERAPHPAFDPRRWPWWVQTLAVYTVSRVFLVVVFVRVALVQRANLWTPARPPYLDYVATLFDGTWYRTIAETGYPSTLPVDSAGLVTQNAWAFFPAFPMLVRAVMTLTSGTWIVVAPLVDRVAAHFSLVSPSIAARAQSGAAGQKASEAIAVGHAENAKDKR